MQLQRLSIAPGQLVAGKIRLTSEQQHYLQRVLRLQPGARFIALDGCGSSWLSELSEPSAARVISPVDVCSELAADITLLVALPKGNGFEETIRCCTELGAAAFVPVLSERALLRPSANRVARWRRIAAEAAEQSERALIPTIAEPLSFPDAIARFATGARYLCVARRDAPHAIAAITPGSLVIATGPEGGWTPTEVDIAIAGGYQPVTLGPRILRAVTAPIAVIAAIAARIEAGQENL
ncbi:RNA methyltransferase, RsmE family [Rubidibacter lacunae KORDI 51-2]|uniref:Ribosomal RNA small subunit methyltransferase E n=1 Tax=Rubidibacter lacunae KORDI 51-2 TaxID=582515 RepID=U5DTD4_9CHRO|nr:16S rRNA (uracil(1498)-N(3))-methyltransferase [Rubidibacter lacunae]ERN42940.1 RNA methyltransferase, RsmE family [Rubidibacter lacunae KORDI 51-2]